MDALVLGGTRYVGLRLVELLHRQGHRVTVLNRGQLPVQQLHQALTEATDTAAYDSRPFQPSLVQEARDKLAGLRRSFALRTG